MQAKKNNSPKRCSRGVTVRDVICSRTAPYMIPKRVDLEKDVLLTHHFSHWSRLALFLLVLFYGAAGILHLRDPDPFILITPDWVPYPRQVIEATGLCEIAGSIGLLLPRFRAFAGIMLALYAVCVFPANVKHAVDGIAVPGLPQSWWYHSIRLALQPLIVWWALFAGGVIKWPWRDGAQADDKNNDGIDCERR